jgi:D-alanyl-lipoteichoic acid acyltransferase DltB (MBOAT superfamily)
MQFNTIAFVAFFAVVLLLHNLPLSWRVRKFNLLWLSYLFYSTWNPPFVVLLWISTVADWRIAKWLHAAEDPRKRRLLLLPSLIINLGMLSYFKYGNFALENFRAALGALGVDWQPALPDILLPMGISFYTFQTLSYTLDIYAKRTRPWHSFLDYALFVSFFPQLVAGPIVRSRQFLPQCEKPPLVTSRQIGWGLALIVIGLFEKSVLADGIIAPIVESVVNGTGQPTALDSWLVILGFTCQIFCDFAGYSICAIGVARCLGFYLPMNFNCPLAATGPADFWRRWHITLSSWLRDYLYYALGGSRVSFWRWVFNIVLTFTLIGFWHAASWNWLLFGVISGISLVVERLLRIVAPASPIWSKRPVLFGFACIQFAFLATSLMIWRPPSLERFAEIVAPAYFGAPAGRAMLLSTTSVLTLGATIVVMFLWQWFMRDSSLDELSHRTPWFIKAAALAFMLIAIVLMPGENRAFIYFQF